MDSLLIWVAKTPKCISENTLLVGFYFSCESPTYHPYLIIATKFLSLIKNYVDRYCVIDFFLLKKYNRVRVLHIKFD